MKLFRGSAQLAWLKVRSIKSLRFLLARPRLVFALLIVGTGLTAGLYASLGAWLAYSNDKPITALSLNENELATVKQVEADTQKTMQAIEQVSQLASQMEVAATETLSSAQAETGDEPYALLSHQEGGLQTSGRRDPFAPVLLTPPATTPAPSSPEVAAAVELPQVEASDELTDAQIQAIVDRYR